MKILHIVNDGFKRITLFRDIRDLLYSKGIAILKMTSTVISTADCEYIIEEVSELDKVRGMSFDKVVVEEWNKDIPFGSFCIWNKISEKATTLTNKQYLDDLFGDFYD